MMSQDPDLDALDDAVRDLRRLGERPGYRRRFMAELGEPIELGMLRTLREVGRAGDEEISIGDVADRLGVDSSTASRLVEQTVAAGYLAREPASTDRRRARLELTEEGAALLDRAGRIRHQLLAEVTADWTPEQVRTLADLLLRLRRGFDRFEAS